MADGPGDGEELVAGERAETNGGDDREDDAVSAAPAPEREVIPKWVRRSIALFFSWVVGLLLAYWLVTKLHSVLLMLLAALFLSLSMEPPVNYLARERNWRRGPATALVLFGVIVIGLVFVAAILSVVVQEVSRFVDEAPHYVRDVERFANDHFGLDLKVDKLVEDLQSRQGPLRSFADDFAKGALDVTVTALGFLLQVVTTLVFAFYMTADGPKLRRNICSLLPPARQRRVLDTWEVAIDKTGGYLYSRGIQAVISAVATWLMLTVVGVPYPLALGLWVGVISQFIPTIGTYIAMVLPVLIALIRDPLKAVIVLAFLVLYQQFENYVIGPRITKRTMQVHPALAIGTVFVGGALLGPIGAVLALPATGVLQALVSASAQRYEVIDGHLTEVPDEPARPPLVERIRRAAARRRSGGGVGKR